MATKIEKSSMTQTIDGKVTREAKIDNSKQNFQWWKAETDDELADQVGQTVRFLQLHQGDRLNQLIANTRLYGNSSSFGSLGSTFTRSENAASPAHQRISFNLCSSVIDTLTAKFAKNKIIPTFITQGATWGMQKKAENLSKFIDGAFYEQKEHEKKVIAFRDSGVWGDGLVKVYRDQSDRAAICRVLPHTIVIDIVESEIATPRQMHELRPVDRNIVMDMFPEHAARIESCNPTSPEDLGATHTASDLVTVCESWHLKSGPDATDGLRCITLLDTGLTLERSVWKYDYFPFPNLSYSKRLLGYWSQGACERLSNLQGEINRLMILIQRCMWMGGAFKILSHVNDKVPTQHFTNDVGPIIKWSGDIAPQYIAPPIIQADIYPYVDALISKGYQQEGVSQLGAASVKPIGVNSGTALRTYDEIADDRQLWVGQQIEQFELEIARQMIDVVKDVAKEKGSYKVRYASANFVETIDWKDVNLEEDEYYIKAFPTSELPEEPVARLQTVQEFAQAGWISPRAARRLMRTEDIEMSDNLANAAESLICKSIEAILYDAQSADQVRPNSYWDLSLAKDLISQYYNYATLNDCPEERLAELNTWASYVDDELKLTLPPAPPPMGAPGAPAPANPQATPQSELLPNVNQGAA